MCESEALTVQLPVCIHSSLVGLGLVGSVGGFTRGLGVGVGVYFASYPEPTKPNPTRSFDIKLLLI